MKCNYLANGTNERLIHSVLGFSVFVFVLLMVFSLDLNAAPIQRSITISSDSSVDATFSDWTTSDNNTAVTVASDWLQPTTVTNNSGQFSTDEQYETTCATMADLDCSTSSAGVGRDLRRFAYTWDNANLYMYVERFASNSSANDWWFYLDTNANGLMELNEPVLNVKWTGSNGKTVRQLWTYVPARVGVGDPMTCPNDGGINTVTTGYCPVEGEGDGYDMPGTLNAGFTYATLYGGATSGSGAADPNAPDALLAGVAMETFISWSDLDAAAGTSIGGPRSVGFHISSSNGENIPGQLDDNMNGLPGGSGGIGFSDLAITKTASSATVVSGDQFSYILTVTNNGGSNATAIEVTDILPAEVTYDSDNSATTSTTTTLTGGDTLVWDIPALANGASIVLEITVTSVILPDATPISVTNTATITDHFQADVDLSNNSATHEILTLILAPDLEITKTHVGNFSEGASGAYTIAVSNVGLGDEIGVITVTDVMPTGLTFVSGTGTDWTCTSDFPTSPETVTCTNPGPLLVGNALDDIQLLVTVDAAAIPGVTNTASVSGVTHDNVLGNNSSDDLTTVNPATGQQCYAVDGNNDVLSLVETDVLLTVATNETDIGATGATGIDSVAYDCGTGTLFAADNGQLGTLNQATGSFTSLGAAGSSANGSIGGNINFINIKGLTQDPSSGALYASVSRTGTDVLIQINKAIGAFVPNAFGDGIDYVTIGSIADVSDIAVVSGGTLYGIDSGTNNLISINKLTGATSVVGALGITNITGLGTDSVGALWGSTSTSAIPENVYSISTTTGAATTPRPIDGGAGTSFNYGAFDCIANCALKKAELAITKTVSDANPLVAASISYTVTVTNNGGDTATAVQVSDVLPAGVTFASSTPSQGSYDETTGVWYIGSINSGADATLQISVTVDAGTAGSTITNTASISYATQNDPNTANNTASVNIVPVNSNLSTSTKAGVDDNGGSLLIGDTIHYTITVIETSGANANGISITDTIPAGTENLTNLTFDPVLAPSVINASTATTLDVSNLDIAAGGTVTIEFDVTVSAGTANNTIIINTATITNPSGPGSTPSSAPLVVTGGAEVKTLYLLGSGALTREEVTATTNTTTTIIKNSSNTWTLDPAIFSDMRLDNFSIAVPIWLDNSNNSNVSVSATLSYGGTPIGTVSTVTSVKNTFVRHTFSFNPGGIITVAAGSTYELTITNNSTSKDVDVHTFNGTHSQIDLNSLDVIKVNGVEFYDAVYPGGNLITSTFPGDTVFIRSVVQDPFGSFDITSASIEILDSLGATKVVAGTPMGEVDVPAPDDGTKTYEYEYLVPATGPTGNWTALVTTKEGTENTVSHTATGNLAVRDQPSITLLKMVQTISDPVNAGVNPKAIPGAYINYTIIATNSGAGYVNPDATFVIDGIPANTEFFVNDLGGAAPGAGPILFSAGSSGLTYTTNTDLSYSTVGSAGPWTLWSASTPAPDGNGVNANVKAIQVNPKGIFAGAGASNTTFSLIFRVRLQ